MHVNVLVSQLKESAKVNEKTGVKTRWTEIQGTLVQDDGTQEVFVYSMFPKRGDEPAVIPPGTYSPVVRLAPSWQDRKLQAEITQLVPVKVPALKAA